MPDLNFPAVPRVKSKDIAAGRPWLIAGGIATAISLVLLVPMAVQNLRPLGIPGTAAVVVCILYAGMVIVRHSTPRSRLRTALLALDLMAIVFVTVLTGLLVGARLLA